MRSGELFDLPELRIPLSSTQRDEALHRIIDLAYRGAKYAYTVKETCGILKISRDEMDHLIHYYKLDALSLGVIYRIPWYALSEYLLDADDSLEAAFDEYIRSRYRAA